MEDCKSIVYSSAGIPVAHLAGEHVSANIWYYDHPMEWKVEYLAAENILYVKTKGILTSESANEMVKEIVSAVSRFQCKRQIIDHRGTTFALTVSEYYQRPRINQEIGISRTWKIAMVFKELNQDTHFMETVFMNRGFTFRVFQDIDEAKAWISKQ